MNQRPSLVNVLRHHAETIFAAGVAGVQGDRLVREAVRWTANQLHVGDHRLSAESIRRLIIVGGGKASASMAVGLIDSLVSQSRFDPLRAGEVTGHVNVPEGNDATVAMLRERAPEVTVWQTRPAGINEPTQHSIEGSQRMRKLVAASGPGDVVFVMVSGGGSALMCQPSGRVTLDDKIKVVRHLSSRGASISQINTVRKHLSELKGGRLAMASLSGRLCGLILSDVLGDPIELIASGPTVEDSSTAEEAITVLDEFDPWRSLPSRIREHLEVQLDRDRPVFPHDRVTNLILGNNAVAVDAAGISAERLGYNHIMQSSTHGEDTAESVGVRLAELTVQMLRAAGGMNGHSHDALILGGEPVVKLVDADVRGRGGRNQQLALAAYQRLIEIGLSEDEWSRVVILSAGTDGEDGPTDAAGAVVDGQVHSRATANFLTPEPFLFRNDAYEFFRLADGLLRTGPTGTNVCDLRIALVDLPNRARPPR